MKRAMKLAIALLLVIWAGVGISACGSKPAGASMSRFKSCEDLMKAFKKGQEGYKCNGDATLRTSVEESAHGAESFDKPEHSTTNVQVEEVDEADIVKNDGEFIYTISGDSVVILKAYPPEEGKVVSRIKCDRESSLHELFIKDDKLVVIGSSYYPEKEGSEESEIRSQAGITFVEIFDVSNRGEPRLLRTIEYEGDYSTSRRVEDDVYLVLTTYPYHVFYDAEELKCSDIIPGFRDTWQEEEPADFKPACSCEEVEYVDPDGFSSFLSILSISLEDQGDSVDKRVIAGYSESVYASPENIYVASVDYRYWYRPEPASQEEIKTTIYKFKLDGPKTTYQTSAEVPGAVLNQFSMDEYQGYFRIATTREQVRREGATSTNNVYVLNPDLEMAGKLEGLAPGETIHSARFMGAKAYLVTFKKIDPFFVLDLADPENPKVLGALKIPGYSDYLHPYDENHIIGIGKNTAEVSPEEEGFVWHQGIKIALFDVSDVTNPIESHKVIIGDRGTESYALHDHKAFLFDKDKNLLVMPILLAELTPEQKASPDTQAYDYGEYTYQGAYVYDISPISGIKLKGRVTHIDNPAELSDDYYYYDSNKAVQRSLYIGDYLYTISDARVKVNRLLDVSEVGSIQLTGQ